MAESGQGGPCQRPLQASAGASVRSDGTKTDTHKMEKLALRVQKEKMNSRLGRSTQSCQPERELAGSPCSPERCLCQTHSCKTAWGSVLWDSPSSAQQSVVTWHIFARLPQHMSSLRKLPEGLLESDHSKRRWRDVIYFYKKSRSSVAIKLSRFFPSSYSSADVAAASTKD